MHTLPRSLFTHGDKGVFLDQVSHWHVDGGRAHTPIVFSMCNGEIIEMGDAEASGRKIERALIDFIKMENGQQIR